MPASPILSRYPNKLPPDGGWGWIIVLANAICNIVTLPSMTNFGLIYKDKLTDIGVTASEIALIINFNSAIGMGIGLFTGPLLKSFGYRKIAIIGGIFFAAGTFLTSFADSFSHFIITYSIITATGYGLSTASFALALNTYFKERRSKAAGITMALSGFGPIFYPPMITYLLGAFGVQNCVLVLGGIALNIILAAILLQPIKYHLKDKPENSATLIAPSLSINSASSEPIASTKPDEENVEKTSECIIDVSKDIKENTQTEQMANEEEEKMLPTRSDDNNSLATIENGKMDNLPSQLPQSLGLSKSAQLYDSLKNGSGYNLAANTRNASTRRLNPNASAIEKISITVSQKCKSIEWNLARNWLINFFDLDLLKDKIFVNILVGIAFATFAEINFSVLTPFILSEMNYSTLQIASVMSTLAISDIIARFLAPFIGDTLKFSPRVMYMISLIGLVAGRAAVLFVTSYQGLLLVGIGLGIAKGIRTVYMILVIPAHVPLDKLPSASGIRMLFNGLMLVILGVVVGRLMNKSGGYANCIIFINCVTLVCVVLWTVELVYCKCIAKRKEQQNENTNTNC